MTNLSPKDSPAAFAIQFLGTQPHLGQIEFLECRAPIKVLCSGRRWGKSTTAAMDLLWFAVTRPGTTQVILGPTLDQANIIFDMAYQLADNGLLKPLLSEIVRSPFPKMTLVVSDGSGGQAKSVIMARPVGHDGKYLRGHGADRVIVDEAAYVPERVLTEVVRPMLASSRYGELVLISTPFGYNYFHEYFARGRGAESGVQSFQFASHSNPHLSREYLESQERELPDMAFRVEYRAEFTEDQASVFRQSFISAAIDPDIETGVVMDGHEYVIGFDPAKYSDRSGVVVIDATDMPRRVVEVLDIAGRDYSLQAQTVARLASRYNRAPVLLDATIHDQMLEELKRNGVRAEGYSFNNTSKQNLINKLVLTFENREIMIPPDADLLLELQYYRFKRTSTGNVQLGAPNRVGMHDDLVTALALAVYQAGNVGDGCYIPDYGRLDDFMTIINRVASRGF